MQIFGSHLNMEMQQRGSEYSQLFAKYDNLRPALLERMPPLEVTHSEAHGSELTNGEQTPSPISGDELGIVEPEIAQDSVSRIYRNEIVYGGKDTKMMFCFL